MSSHPPPYPRGPGATPGLSDLEVQGSGQAQHRTGLSAAGQRGRRRAPSQGHGGAAAAAGSPRGSGAAARAEALPASAWSEGHAGGTTSRASWRRQVWRGRDKGRERTLFSSGILRSQPSAEALGVRVEGPRELSAAKVGLAAATRNLSRSGWCSGLRLMGATHSLATGRTVGPGQTLKSAPVQMA